jgi:secondary thiamine-phosphate synthase enzyme
MITREVIETMPEIRDVDCGMLNIFLQHTSASITINENADPDVQKDIQMALGKIVPNSLPYAHTLEGQDDMPAHIKSSMVGVSVDIPIGQGRLLLGTWQGIYLCEHRQTSHRRSIVLTVWGKKRNNME